MPHSDYDLAGIRAAIITTNNRVLAGGRPDRGGQLAVEQPAAAGLQTSEPVVIPEEHHAVAEQLRDSLDEGNRLVIVLGGTGFGIRHESPEVVREAIEVEIPGIAEQIRAHGLTNTPLSPLSREVVGVTARDKTGALVVASPSSKGGVADTLSVLIPLLKDIFGQLDEI